VVVTGRDEVRLNATLVALAGNGHRAIRADLTVTSELQRLADECGQIDGLFFQPESRPSHRSS
jgi:hypothetical protein